jgi:hypothetical protein
MSKPSQNRQEIRPLTDIRFDKTGHWPTMDDKKEAVRCKKENCQQRTHMYCIKCKVHLCCTKSNNCFFDFH